MSFDAAKLAEFKTIEQPAVAEIVAVYWNAPDSVKYYSFTAVDELINFSACPLKPVEPRLTRRNFLEFELSADISDDQIPLEFDDADREITNLFYRSGEGVKVELFYYFPDVDWLCSVWWGQLLPPDEADYEKFRAKAATGFLSQLLPLPRREIRSSCAAIFGGLLATQAEIDTNDCPYNRHLGGGVGNLDGNNQPFTRCPRDTRQTCGAILGNPAYFMGANGGNFTYVSSPRPGGNSVAKGNESNLKNPLRVILGAKHVRDFDVFFAAVERDPARADRAFLAVLFRIAEGPIDAFFGFQINDIHVGSQHFFWRNGQIGGPPVGYPPGNAFSYSGTGIAFGRIGYVPDSFDTRQIKSFAAVHGINNIPVYSTPTMFVRRWTNSRAWNLLECYRNRRWGRGYAESRFDLPSWIDTAEWCAKTITFTPPDGTPTLTLPHRTIFDAVLEGRPSQNVIADICRSGRLGIPFQHNGKYKIVPLRKETDLASVPVFSDTGENRNILRASGGKPLISYKILSDRDLPNKLVLTYEDGTFVTDIERPLTFEDEAQQFRAGRAFGDSGLRVVERRVNAFGVRSFSEAIKLGWQTLYLGDFDEGGLKNNLRVALTVWFADALGLQKYQIIKIESPLIAAFGFQYFRLQKLRRNSDLSVRLTAQAYPVDYYETMEIETGASGSVAQPDMQLRPLPEPAGFGDIAYNDGQFSITVD